MLRNSRIIPLLLLALTGLLWFASVNNGLPAETTTPARYSAIDAPNLKISKRPGRINLSGHTASRRHENDLLQTVARFFSAAQSSSNFQPLGTAPDYWAPASRALLEALSATISANAEFVGDRIRVRGVSTAAWSETARHLRDDLPESVVLDIKMIITDGAVNVLDLCERAFTEYRTGAINFEASTTLLRNASNLALDRAISLADACRGSVIVITGHTDASGPEFWNRSLSLARANAVADYLVKGGIARKRLRTLGVGSSNPLASSDSRYGRSLNRRVEIQFQPDP